MKIVNVYGGTLSSSRVKRMGGIEEHFLSMSKLLKGDLYLVYAGKPRDQLFVKQFESNASHLIILGDQTYLSYLKNFMKLINILKKEDEDIVVHVHFLPLSYMIIILSKILGIKEIYWTKHSKLMIKEYSKSWFLNKLPSLFVAKILCVSLSVKRELEDLNIASQKLCVIPLGINIDKYNKIISEKEKIALRQELILNKKTYVITIVAQQRLEKKVDIFIKAFAQFMNENNITDVVGLIVGGGPLEKENIRLAKQLDVYENLRFMGLRHDIPLIYSISDVAGLTSETEGFGLALAEASAMHLPLFGTDAGAIPEVILNNESGFLFQNGDYKSLANFFFKFYNDKTLREKFGNRGYHFIHEKYDIVKCSQNLLKLYKEI